MADFNLNVNKSQFNDIEANNDDTNAIKSTTLSSKTDKRYSLEEALEFFAMPFGDLVSHARKIYEENFNTNQVQISTLLSIKTGGCPENCSYCPQSAHYQTGVNKETLMGVDDVVAAAKKAKESGASRFCMGAAWRSPHDTQLGNVVDMIKEVKKLGLETCATLGMLKPHQAKTLKEAGLDFYNHNIDCSEDFYSEIITTRKFADRIATLENVAAAGINTCCGGIIGMGETIIDRAKMLLTLANMPEPPKSVPINLLIRVPGTPLADVEPPHPIDMIKMISVARILMPKSYIRLSAGRENMSEECQAFCFYVGANSIFYGEKLLTAQNPVPEKDVKLFEKLGITGV